ncbi:hypothetical protein [Legionella sp.]|uniref:hypothetical protein n=1 Tax=Legionella sp. TaxID=459 RepID=UPI003C803923
MQSNGFEGNSKLFITGISCLVISLGLFFFCLYILPYFLWQLSYPIPDFIFNLLAKYQDDYHYSSAGSKFFIWLIFFVPCVITGLICYFISQHLDKQRLGIPSQSGSKMSDDQLQKQIKESVSLGGKILGLMIAIVVILLLLQYLIQSTA